MDSKPLWILGDAAILAAILVVACFDVKAAVIGYLAIGIFSKVFQSLTALLEPIVEALKR